MIQVFCAKRGAGKTKRLIELANEHLSKAKGDSVYIDDDARRMMQLKGKIRFINTNELGVISQNYDVENIYIDALSSIVTKNMSESAKLFGKLKEFSQKFNLNLYINLNCECSDELPDLIREYVA